MNIFNLSKLMILILFTGFISCNEDDKTDSVITNKNQLNGKFAMLTNIGETAGVQGNSYLQVVENFEKTVTNKKAIENTSKGTIATFGNHVYYASFFSQDIKRYKINSDNSLTPDGELAIPMVADIVILNKNKGYILQNKFELKEFNPTTFKITKSISLQQYNNKTTEYPLSKVGEIVVRKSDNKLFIPVHYIHSMKFQKIETSLSIIVIDGNANTVEKLITDDRTYTPGMIIGSGGSGFSIDENNDIYITCSAGFGYKKDLIKNPAILRIKNGETEIDNDYFFDLKETNIVVCQGLLCVNNGIAYTFKQDKSLIKPDFTNVVFAPCYKPIQLNLKTKKVISEVKNYSGTASLNGLWLKPFDNNTKCYLPLNNGKDNGVYELNFATNECKKVFNVNGAVTSFELIE